MERAIRSVKCVVAVILHNGLSDLPAIKCRTPTDFELLSIFCEVEATVNCRPTTKFRTSIEDWRGLTTITWLIGNLHPKSPVKEFNKSDMYRPNFKCRIAVAEQF